MPAERRGAHLRAVPHHARPAAPASASRSRGASSSCTAGAVTARTPPGRRRGVPRRDSLNASAMARILVVDDDEGVRTFVAEALEVDGHAVQQAADGADAALPARRARASTSCSPISGCPAWTAWRSCARRAPSSRSWRSSCSPRTARSRRAVEAMKLGAFDYLQKPHRGPGGAAAPGGARGRAPHAARSSGEERDRERGAGPPLTWGAPAMRPVEEALRKVARTDATVLLLGESGTGKEVAARALHRVERARRRALRRRQLRRALGDAPRERALRPREGRLHRRRRAAREAASSSPTAARSSSTRSASCSPSCRRSSCACCRSGASSASAGRRPWPPTCAGSPPPTAICVPRCEAGRFREDLYHRLAVFPVRHAAAARAARGPAAAGGYPARADRRDARAPAAAGSAPPRAPRLLAAAWPGNVRELANALERAAILADGDGDRPGASASLEPARRSRRRAPGSTPDARRARTRRDRAHARRRRRQSQERRGAPRDRAAHAVREAQAIPPRLTRSDCRGRLAFAPRARAGCSSWRSSVPRSCFRHAAGSTCAPRCSPADPRRCRRFAGATAASPSSSGRSSSRTARCTSSSSGPLDGAWRSR